MIKSGLVVATNYFNKVHSSIMDYTHSSNFYVLPWHLDLNLHVNNATYLNFCNQTRTEYLATSGMLRFLVQKKINPIIFKNEIQYKKSLKLFDRFQIETKLQQVERKEAVIEHKILKNGTVMAICYSHIKLVSKESFDYLELLQEFSSEKK